VDRAQGSSKIPKLQIITSACDLLLLSAQRVLRLGRDLSPDVYVPDACVSCGDKVLAMKFPGNRDRREEPQVAAYRCTSVGSRSHPPVYTCLNCGLDQVPQSMVPSHLEELYEKVEDVAFLENISARERAFARCFDRLQRWLPPEPGTMLEIGAYCGLFLREAKVRRWQADGIEPSRWAADCARNTSGVNVHSGFLVENKAKLRPQYDVVVSWDVLEHVLDPVGFVRECTAMLPIGGMFFFSTLDTGNWFAKLLGKRRRGFWTCTFNTLTCARSRTFCGAGFDLIAYEPYTHYARVRYMLDGGARIMPSFLAGPINVSFVAFQSGNPAVLPKRFVRAEEAVWRG
jgi:hypothetical protein